MAFSDARNERDRRDTGRNSDNHGSRNDRRDEGRSRSQGAYGNESGQTGARGRSGAAERANRDAMNRRGGARGAGSSTAADHLVAMGKVSTPSIPAGGVATGNYPTQDDAYNDYSKAVGKHATRGFIDRALDWLGGGFYDAQEPMAGNPRSFAGGDYHTSSNPGSILGGLIGSFMGPAGMLTGPLMGSAYTGLGLPDIWHGGYGQPDIRTGPLGNSTGPLGGTMAGIGGGHTYPSGGGLGGGTGMGNPRGMANAGNMGGVLAPQQAGTPGSQTGGQSAGAPASTGGIPNYPQFSWAQPWPGSQPQTGGPLSSWNMPTQQQGLMAPNQQWSGWR